jgi:glycosyltransferase involved in cell wall biosynthesis
MLTEGLITIAVPLYNHGKFIETCLDSVLGQGLSDIELLLLDDGSKDDGYAIACRWEEKNRHHFKRTVFRTQANAGITRTMDQLIRWAEGKYVLLVASDDALVPDSIVSRLGYFEDEKVSAVFGDAIPIDENGQILGKSAIGELGLKAAREALRDPRTICWELIFRWNVYGSVLMCRREALMADGGRSVLDLRLYGEDMQLYYRFSSQNTLRYLDRPVALYRVHAGSTCRSPENEHKIRENMYLSRRHAMRSIKGWKCWILRLQMMTYFRTQDGLSGWVLKPFVLCAYGMLLVSRVGYDLARKWLLGQKKVASSI